MTTPARAMRLRLMYRCLLWLPVCVRLWWGGTLGAETGSDRIAALKNEAKRYYWGVGVRQDYRQALQRYEQAAKRGDVEASYIAGGMYYTGKGATKDLVKAFTYLDFAAAQGKSSAASERALAQFYLLGAVVPQNYAKAAEWYERAAAAGDVEAQIELGFLHFVGRGVQQDFDQAYELFRQAAYRNSGVAQYNMGIMWYTGNGVPDSDLAMAHAWFSIAAGNGFGDGAQARDYLSSVLSDDEIARAQQQAAQIHQDIRAGRIPAATVTGQGP